MDFFITYIVCALAFVVIALLLEDDDQPPVL
jgi:hypothetical protein